MTCMTDKETPEWFCPNCGSDEGVPTEANWEEYHDGGYEHFSETCCTECIIAFMNGRSEDPREDMLYDLGDMAYDASVEREF